LPTSSDPSTAECPALASPKTKMNLENTPSSPQQKGKKAWVYSLLWIGERQRDNKNILRASQIPVDMYGREIANNTKIYNNKCNLSLQ
jgi:hypothetical protein